MTSQYFWIFICLIPLIETTWTPSYAATWKISDPYNPSETCLLLTGDFLLVIPYSLETSKIGHASVPVPKSALGYGTCAEMRQQISISWPVPDNSSVYNVLTFSFKKNSSIDIEVKGYYQLIEVKVTVHSNPLEFPQAEHPGKIFTLTGSFLHLWTAPVKLSYFCDTEYEVPLSLAGAFLRMSHVQVEPFYETPVGGLSSEFSVRYYCQPDVQSMMTDGVLFIVFLFLVSILIVYALHRRRRFAYVPI